MRNGWLFGQQFTRFNPIEESFREDFVVFAVHCRSQFHIQDGFYPIVFFQTVVLFSFAGRKIYNPC